LAHDIYYKLIDPTASTSKRVFLSKALLVTAAITAAYVTSLKPGDILFLVGAAFSLGASSFFPALVMGIFWKRASKWGAIVGMAVGLGLCAYYMYTRYPFFGVNMPLWFGLSPVSAGMFGLPASMLTIFIVSWLTPAPPKEVQELVEHVRYPNLVGDTVVSEAR
jgi:cation/acetate symporter